MTDTATLCGFLLARIAEDEARARTGRDMRECEAKRQIVKEHGSGFDPCDAHDADFRSVPCDTLLYLAVVYRDHRNYREEWAPQ